MPLRSASAENIIAPQAESSTTAKVITALTIASLGAGTVATVVSLRKAKKK